MVLFVEYLEKRTLFSGDASVFFIQALKQSITVAAGKTSPSIRVEALDVHRHLLKQASGDVTFSLLFEGAVQRSLGSVPLRNGMAAIPGVNLTQASPYIVSASMPGVLFSGGEEISVTGARPATLSLQSSLYIGESEGVILQLLDRYGNYTSDRSTIRLGASNPASAGAFIQVKSSTGQRNDGVIVHNGKAVAVRFVGGQYGVVLGTKATGSDNVTVQLVDSDRWLAPVSLTFPFTQPGLE